MLCSRQTDRAVSPPSAWRSMRIISSVLWVLPFMSISPWPLRNTHIESGSTIVRVNLRKKQKLYINDGTYGSLFDAGTPNLIYPTRLITNGRIVSKKMTAFDFYGPTCDSMDYMKGPFVLPNNIKEGDYIELGQLGAYGLTFRTQFNGFYSNEIYEVEDNPIISMYDKETSKQFLVA